MGLWLKTIDEPNQLNKYTRNKFLYFKVSVKLKSGSFKYKYDDTHAFSLEISKEWF